jgi:hypothetical protein
MPYTPWPMARPIVLRESLVPLRISGRALAAVTGVGVVLLTALACWLRLPALAGAGGTLSVDEARLALAGQGILEHGVPTLPSGWTYTRGLLSAYLVAASFAVLGPTDAAARLPSVLAGTALVPVMYLLGAVVGGRAGGLFAAALVAAYPPLVFWSGQAWLYAVYILCWAVALLFIVRAQASGSARDQLLAGSAVGLAFFAHELAVFLLVPLGAQVLLALASKGPGANSAVRETSSSPPPARRPSLIPLASFGIALAAGAVLWALVTGLRSETLVGPYGEIREYFSPRLEGVPFRFYGRMLLDGRGLLLVTALVGVPLAFVARSSVALVLWLALLPPLIHAMTIIPDQPQERYGLTPVLALIVLAALGVRLAAGWVVGRAGLRVSPGLLTTLALGLILLVHLDVGRAVERGAPAARGAPWLREARALGIGPEDLVMSDLPTVVGWYVGGLDYWASSRDYQKYTVRDEDGRRDVHTGAVLVRNAADYRELVAGPNRGRTLWVLVSGRSYQWGELVDDDLKRLLERSAARRVDLGGGISHALRIDLP